MEKKVRISCVSYLNSRPFIDGLQRSNILEKASLSLDIPATCADKLLNGEADLGLVPVVMVPALPQAHIVSDFCIGADGPVDTVLLLSDVPLAEIENIEPDPHSRTSVMLARVLAERYWKIRPQWNSKPGPGNAKVLIGDKTFSEKKKYKYAIDLAGEWKKYTGLPFVFACWVSTQLLPGDFLAQFNEALAEGVARRQDLAKELAWEYPGIDIAGYLEKRIRYNLDGKKREAMDLFFRLTGNLEMAG